jgi:hypothetical protein
MEQSPSHEDVNWSAGQNVSSLLWYSIHESQPLEVILKKPIHVLLQWSKFWYFNLI